MPTPTTVNFDAEMRRKIELVRKKLTPTTVNVDPETRRKIERARQKLARKTIVPSVNQIMREALSIGLDVVLDGDAHSAKGAPVAAR
jgi:hypothetical protein